MTSGNFTTSSNIIELGNSTSTLGTLSYTDGTIIGNFKRWFDTSTTTNTLFPLGSSSNYCPASLSFTGAPTSGGSLTAFYTVGDAGTNGVDLTTSPIDDGGYSINKIATDGYWTINSGDGLSGGTYSVDLTLDGIYGVSDYTSLHLLKRANSSQNWAALGTHIATTGSNTTPTLHRSGLTSFSNFVPGTGIDNPLPIQLANFNGECINNNINFSFSTLEEINCKNFEIEASKNGMLYYPLTNIKAQNNINGAIYNYLYYDHIKTYNYYRLKQYDYNGKVEIFDPIYINCTGLRNQFEIISVNYTYNELNYIVSSPDYNKSNIYIIDVLGNILLSKDINFIEGEQLYNLKLDNLSSGIYFIKIVSKENISSKQFIVK